MSRTPPPPLPRDTSQAWTDPPEYNPFDKVEALPGLGIAVLWVVLSYVLANLLLSLRAN